MSPSVLSEKLLSPFQSLLFHQDQLVCTWSAHCLQSGPSKSPFPRDYHALSATATAAGELFLFGGYVHTTPSDDVYVISTRDFSTTHLQTSGDVPSPRGGHDVALTSTNLLIWGGKKDFASLSKPLDDSIRFLNLASREWSCIVADGPRPCRRYYHTVTMVGSKFFVFGGQNGGNFLNDMWALDWNSLKYHPVWELYKPTPRKEKPHPRSCHVSVTTEDHIIVFGGYGDGHRYNDTWSFNILTRKWTELQCTGSIPSPRASHSAVLVDDVMYVYGGTTGKTYVDDLYALQLSTRQWFKFHNVGTSPPRKWAHAMASDGTRVFVPGGNTLGARSDESSLIHVFDTKDIKYPEPERNAVNLDEKTTQLARKPSTVTGSPAQEQPQYPKSSSSEAQGASRLQNATPTVSGNPAFLQITHERNPGPNDRPLELTGANSEPRRAPEDDASEDSTEFHAIFAASDSSSEGEVARLELERQLPISLSAQTERDHRIAQLTNELALKSTRHEQVEANAVEAARHAGPAGPREHADDQRTPLVKQRDVELVDIQARLGDMQAKLDDLLLSRDQLIGRYEKEFANVRAKLEAKESELEAVRLRLADAEKGWTMSKAEADPPRDQLIEQHEKELANMRAKLEANESELDAVRLRLTDAEKGWTKSKAEADTLRAQTATGSVNRGEDQVTRGLMERMRVLEVEVASKRWNEKSIEEMECRNEG